MRRRLPSRPPRLHLELLNLRYVRECVGFGTASTTHQSLVAKWVRGWAHPLREFLKDLGWLPRAGKAYDPYCVFVQAYQVAVERLPLRRWSHAPRLVSIWCSV